MPTPWRRASRSPTRGSTSGSRPATATRWPSAATTSSTPSGRNVDLNVILFNNEIYGLTKGSTRPRRSSGKITKTSPYGTVEKPFNPGELVIGAKGTFFARSIDMEVVLSKECLVAAALHKGMSVVEVLQNCVIFNDKTHAAFAADKATRAERTITLRHGEKMLFGANKEKGSSSRT